MARNSTSWLLLLSKMNVGYYWTRIRDGYVWLGAYLYHRSFRRRQNELGDVAGNITLVMENLFDFRRDNHEIAKEHQPC